MGQVKHFDHVGITVADLDNAIGFFEAIGLVLDGRMTMEGQFVDDVTGLADSRSEIAMLRAPSGGPGVELSSFERPEHQPGSPEAKSTELGIRNVAFEVTGLDELLERLAADGYGLVGTVGEYENVWRMTYVRGPEGIIVALAERIDIDSEIDSEIGNS